MDELDDYDGPYLSDPVKKAPYSMTQDLIIATTIIVVVLIPALTVLAVLIGGSPDLVDSWMFQRMGGGALP